MSKATYQLIASALQLAPADRLVVANAILARLEGETDDHESQEIREDWSDEISNRIAEIDSGRVKTIPSPEV
ncbi:addiction module protein [Rhodopirellula sp. SWK7]|uniref:addiction module protein n=1 Tax=Rhodopirellula sp. SWK7 TaxID=595460 RepID=UPI0002BF733C|nr:addiction module protein [Rhodopirellula sp. SWK7]EMI40831.1 Addiction module component, CHP02574 [Rhodopirellula sp. SWK7]